MERATENNLTRKVLERCCSLGFALAGIARAERARWADELRQWLDRGEHGEMAYLARNVEVRLDPRELLAGAKSIICVADRYSSGCRLSALGSRPERTAPSAEERGPADSRQPTPESPFALGRIARYARGDDYHVVMKKRLHALCDELAKHFPDESFRACVDTAPLLEREFAAKAGLGAIGKNTMLIAPGRGSYLLLGEVLTTLDLERSPSAIEIDPCETCTRCIDACPTGAITPWKVDATKCISYLTIEHRSVIDERYHEAMGEWIFGCDICQEVCPHNQPTRRRRSVNDVHPAYEERRREIDLLEVLNWNEQARREAFLRSSMKRAKLAMMKRNALVAAGNFLTRQHVNTSTRPAPDRLRGQGQQVAALRRRVEEIARDEGEDEIVRETARMVLSRLA